MFLLWFKSCDKMVLKSETCSNQKTNSSWKFYWLWDHKFYDNFLLKQFSIWKDYYNRYNVTQKRQILYNVADSGDMCLKQSVIWWDFTRGVVLYFALSRSLTISNFLKPEVSSGSWALPATPTGAVKDWRLLPFFFLSLDSTPSWSKSLSSPPHSQIQMLVSVELFGLGRKLRIWLALS